MVHLIGPSLTVQSFGHEPLAEERVFGCEIDPRRDEQRSDLAIGRPLDRVETGRAHELIDRATVSRRVEEDLLGSHIDLTAPRACGPDRRHTTAYRERELEG